MIKRKDKQDADALAIEIDKRIQQWETGRKVKVVRITRESDGSVTVIIAENVHHSRTGGTGQ